MKNLVYVLSFLFFVTVGTFSTHVFADTGSAAVFYEKAVEAYGGKDYKLAAELLDKAYVNDPNLIYVYNKILALQADKQYTAALEEMNVFEAKMLADPENRFEDVPQIKKKLEQQIKATQAVNDPVINNEDPVINNEEPDKSDKYETNSGANGVDDIETPEEGSSKTIGLVLMGTGTFVLVPGILFASGIMDDSYGNTTKVLEYLEPNSSMRQKYILGEVYKNEGCIDIETCAPYKEDIARVTRNRYLGAGLITAGSLLILGGGYLYFVGGADSAGEVPTSADATQFHFAPYLSPESAGATFGLTF